MPTEREVRECLRHGLDIDLQQAVHRATDDYLQTARVRLLRTLAEKPLAHVGWSVVENGEIAHVLLQRAEEGMGSGIQRSSDLLILTTHGRSGMQRWVLGSIAERVLHESTLPLLIVHPSQKQYPFEEGSSEIRQYPHRP